MTENDCTIIQAREPVQALVGQAVETAVWPGELLKAARAVSAIGDRDLAHLLAAKIAGAARSAVEQHDIDGVESLAIAWSLCDQVND